MRNNAAEQSDNFQCTNHAAISLRGTIIHWSFTTNWNSWYIYFGIPHLLSLHCRARSFKISRICKEYRHFFVFQYVKLDETLIQSASEPKFEIVNKSDISQRRSIFHRRIWQICVLSNGDHHFYKVNDYNRLWLCQLKIFDLHHDTLLLQYPCKKYRQSYIRVKKSESKVFRYPFNSMSNLLRTQGIDILPKASLHVLG